MLTAFTFLGMVLWSIKSEMYAPKTLWDSSLSYNRRLLLTKQYAASSKKGVVGRIGKNIPTTPKPTDSNPTVVKRYFFTLFPYLDKLPRSFNGSKTSLDLLYV